MLVTYTGKRGFYKVEGYPPSFDRTIRYKVPAQERLQSDGSWFVKEKYVSTVLTEASKEGITFTTIGFEPDVKVIPNTSLTTDDPYAILHLQPTAPECVVQAAWKALARQLHPDTGGDPDAFVRAKQAYERINVRLRSNP